MILYCTVCLIGVIYVMDKKVDVCRISTGIVNIPIFLVIAGATNAILSLCRPIPLCCCGHICQLLFNVGVIIWGGFLIFANYQYWQTSDPAENFFCPAIPFISAFAFLIILPFWYFSSILCFCLN
jgi:hypothetical protein